MSITLIPLLWCLLQASVDGFYSKYRGVDGLFNVEYTMLLDQEVNAAIVRVSCPGGHPKFGPVELTMSEFFPVAKGTRNPNPYDTYHIIDKDLLRKFNNEVKDNCKKNMTASDFDNAIVVQRGVAQFDS
ncbi:hypothetical protein FOZ63_014044 [Perkinsus olseni]|uniref:Uncharacterized protein n=1 Tax=Perkinsus olseni TaxID=32597 RepID=A0A7J6NPH8_PEROL|nr:hypothetical protein FOZ60_006189 [Perkinsus olseni]KAF4745550.1 hypothetical protein FOZ63_014044 [Perkinsus olseni]